ncbi:MAG: hypothetical protein J6S42_02370, partial [Thermoguttaceae bacterium]|nr:hypothetical protein [Thermoguttaceae bacterium]
MVWQFFGKIIKKPPEPAENTGSGGGQPLTKGEKGRLLPLQHDAAVGDRAAFPLVVNDERV